MSFEADTFNLLRSDPGVTALVPAKSIYCQNAFKPEQPFIVFFRQSTTPTLSTDNGGAGTSRLDNIRLQVACYARSNEVALEIVEAVRLVLERARPTIYIFDDQDVTYDDFPEIYGQTVTFSCWYPKQLPPPPEVSP
jgi:hypothetical protein